MDGPDCNVEGATRSKLRMKLRPRRATVGERRCFRATVRTPNGSRVREARVRIGKRSKLTNDRGKTRVCRTFKKGGRYKVTAVKVGFAKAKKRIRVRRCRSSAQYGGSWSYHSPSARNDDQKRCLALTSSSERSMSGT